MPVPSWDLISPRQVYNDGGDEVHVHDSVCSH